MRNHCNVRLPQHHLRLGAGSEYAAQLLVGLEAPDGRDKEKHEQQSQEHHVDEHADHAAFVLVLDSHCIANRIRRSHQQPKHRQFLAYRQTAQLVAALNLALLQNKSNITNTALGSDHAPQPPVGLRAQDAYAPCVQS